jgi:hypothetical protein
MFSTFLLKKLNLVFRTIILLLHVSPTLISFFHYYHYLSQNNFSVTIDLTDVTYLE